jgi:hypothetical protein
MATTRVLRSLLWLCGLLALGPATDGIAPDPSASVLVTQFPRGELPPIGTERLRTPPAGARIVLLDLAHPGEPPRACLAGLRSAAWPDVSADGERFLFVGQRGEGDVFQVWEARIDGGEPRQVTHGTDDCLEVLYLSTLFTIDARAPRDRLCYSKRTPGGETALFTCDLDGGDEQRITYHPGGAGNALLLDDGRLLFRASTDPWNGLLVVNVDGTDVQAFTSPAAWGARRSRPCQTPDGRVLWLEQGAGAEDARLVGVARVRPFGPRSELALQAGGELRSLGALADGSLVVARHAQADPALPCELWRLDAAAGKPAARLCSDPGWDALDARPIGPHAARPGRSSVVDDTRSSGFLYCLDSRIERERVAPSAAASVELRAWTASEERILGRAPVERDGSFYLEVPVRTALRLLTFDAGGRSVVEMEGWFWVMPRESRGCIGCHEDPELTPANRQPRALRKHPCRMTEGSR